jgi:hypothetical protein
MDNPYFIITDSTTDSDLSSSLFRYRIKIKKSWDRLDIKIQFSHPDSIGDLYGCPSWNLKRFEWLDNKNFLASWWNESSEMSVLYYLFYPWSWVLLFFKILVIFKVSLNKKFRNNPHGFWLVRSIWSMQIAFYFCYVSTNLKGTITRVFEALTHGFYRLGPYELEIKFDKETDKAAMDIYMGKFTNYDHTHFFMA